MTLPDDLTGRTVDVHLAGVLHTGMTVISDKRIRDPYGGSGQFRNIWAVAGDGRHHNIFEAQICAVEGPDDEG